MRWLGEEFENDDGKSNLEVPRKKERAGFDVGPSTLLEAVFSTSLTLLLRIRK